MGKKARGCHAFFYDLGGGVTGEVPNAN